MKNASWVVVLLVGLGIGVAADRMLGGSRSAPSRPSPSPSRPAQQPAAAPPISTGCQRESSSIHFMAASRCARKESGCERCRKRVL